MATYLAITVVPLWKQSRYDTSVFAVDTSNGWKLGQSVSPATSVATEFSSSRERKEPTAVTRFSKRDETSYFLWK